MRTERVLFTIVTPAMNCRQFLARNLASIRGQGLPAGQIEHWVIDGGSKDGTLDYLREQPDVKYISERDRGLSDAVNKGIQRASGEWIIWLNADDALAENSLNEFLRISSKHPDVSIFCGSQKVFGYSGELESVSEGWDNNLKDLLGTRVSIVQASTFVHRRVYEQVGLLDESYRFAMDYEWMVRAMQRFRCQPIAAVLTHYYRREGSITDAGMRGQLREFLRVRRKYGCSRFDWAEWRLRWYLATARLRRIKALRRVGRWITGRYGGRRTSKLVTAPSK